MPVNLAAYHTFGIEVFANEILEIHTLQDLEAAFKRGVFKKNHIILGGGSNVLFKGNFDGMVVLNRLKGITISGHPFDRYKKLCTAQSGESWHEMVCFALKNNLGGIENLSLIPGTVGAAPMQNIGAYGVELKDVFFQLKAFDLQNGTIQIFDASACQFGYRESVFKQEAKNKYFIIEVSLALTTDQHMLKTTYGAIEQQLQQLKLTPSIHTISEAVIQIRQSKLPDPKVWGNAGSFFKNVEVTKEKAEALQLLYPSMPVFPAGELVKIPTGWLIEQCGWKGQQLGNAGCHKDQALVLINLGNATTSEMITLAQSIQKDVWAKFGIQITPEVNLI